MSRSCIRAIAILVVFLGGAAPPALPADAAAPRSILVTVDDLPVAGGHRDPEERRRITAALLAALQKHRVPAVAFVIASQVETPADEAILEAWLSAGHELGSHSWSHPNYTRLDTPAYLEDLERARVRLSAFLSPRGRTLRFFRFPYLREGDTLEKLEAVRTSLAKSGQRNVPVTIDNQDWSFEKRWVEARRAGDAAALTRVGEDYQAALRLAVRYHEERGDALFGRPVPQVLLLHANEVGSAQWDPLFTWLEGTGHRFATADEVLADPALHEEHRFVGPFGFSLWDRIGHERAAAEARAAITELLLQQAAAWTRGDLDAFVAVYADDAVFVSDTGLTHGRAAVLSRYKKKYPDRAAMGALTLEVLDLQTSSGIAVSPGGDALPAATQSASVVARWTLKRAGRADATGFTMLVLEPQPGGWRIVRDASF
jgi:peptidoglycan/xylan/chitin deacetylase (PgdA/CDA1 family)/ketosteroid isomerase-like protein